eukprot:s620_g18.t1
MDFRVHRVSPCGSPCTSSAQRRSCPAMQLRDFQHGGSTASMAITSARMASQRSKGAMKTTTKAPVISLPKEAEHFVIHSDVGTPSAAEPQRGTIVEHRRISVSVRRRRSNDVERKSSPGERRRTSPAKGARFSAVEPSKQKPCSGGRELSPPQEESSRLEDESSAGAPDSQKKEAPPSVDRAADRADRTDRADRVENDLVTASPSSLRREIDVLRLQVQALKDVQEQTAEIHWKVISNVVEERNLWESRFKEATSNDRTVSKIDAAISMTPTPAKSAKSETTRISAPAAPAAPEPPTPAPTAATMGRVVDIPKIDLFGARWQQKIAQIAATPGAFALWCCGGNKIVTWGAAHAGGDISEVQDQLKNVQQVAGSAAAFAAVLADGSVVTWGNPDFGGDSSEVQHQLQNVQQVCSSHGAFAAVLADGSIVAWGDPDDGGDSSEVQDQLNNVKQLKGTPGAFAAILADGSVVTWGYADSGGDSTEVKDQLHNVQQVYSSNGAFAAMLADGSIVTWGDPTSGGDNSRVKDQLQNVQDVQSTRGAFAAILADGSVVAWGNPDDGSDISEVQNQLQHVQQLQGTHEAFAAILKDGSVVTWGCLDCGGDSSQVQDQLQNVKQLQATSGAFAAILEDGSVVTWGDPALGGDSSGVKDQLQNVQDVHSNDNAFAAILASGSVVTRYTLPSTMCIVSTPEGVATLGRRSPVPQAPLMRTARPSVPAPVAVGNRSDAVNAVHVRVSAVQPAVPHAAEEAKLPLDLSKLPTPCRSMAQQARCFVGDDNKGPKEKDMVSVQCQTTMAAHGLRRCSRCGALEPQVA